MVIWVGYGLFSKIAIAFLVAFFPIVVNTVVGLKEIEPELLELARINRASEFDVFKKIRLPNSIPYLFAGIKVAIVLSVTGAIVAEFVAANEGLGYLVLQANYNLDTAFALVILLILAVLSLGLFWLAEIIQRKMAPWSAGVREVDLTPTLQELLSEYRTRTRYNGPDDFVFPTAGGKQDNPSNVRGRFLAAAVEQANAELRGAGKEPIGAVTPHSLRRTFISLLLAAGADVPYVMAQAGHADPKMTLGIYAKVIASKADHGAALDGLVGAADWAATGSEPDSEADGDDPTGSPETRKPARGAGFR